MRRKNFTLVWGRKLFFRVAWPILLLINLGLVLTEMPMTVISLILLLLQVIAQTGMLLVLSYFFLFYPVVYIIPTYYFSRIWAMTILLPLISVYLLDVYSYMRHGVHLNPFIIHHLTNEVESLEWKAYLAIIPVLILMISIWMKGNRYWNLMQRKFMNTNSSWYVWLILISFAGTQIINVYNQINYSKHVQKVLEQFPIRIPIPKVEALSKLDIEKLPQDRDVHFPKKKDFYPKAMQCQADKNFIFVIYEKAPEFLNHIAEHGVKFDSHFVAKADAQSALDNLLYSFPQSLKSPGISESQIMRAFHDYEYHVELFSNNETIKIDGVASSKKMTEAKQWLQSYVESSSTQHFSLFMYIDQNRAYEKTINNLLISLDSHKLLDDTIIVFTALTGEDHKDLTKVPLVFLWNEKGINSFDKITTGYDLMPTMIQEGLNCQADELSYSFGSNLFKKDQTDYFVFNKESSPYLWIHSKQMSFSLKDLDYYSEDLNTSEILKQRSFYYNFFK